MNYLTMKQVFEMSSQEMLRHEEMRLKTLLASPDLCPYEALQHELSLLGVQLNIKVYPQICS